MNTHCFAYIIAFSLLVFSSCSKSISEKQAQKDKEIILQYIEANNLDAQSTESALYYVVENPGTGMQAASNSNVKVAYKGYFTDKVVFDESSYSGISFSLRNVIKGWTEGIALFKEGGMGILLIPSGLAYGSNGTNGIPPNRVLIFEIHLIEVI